MFSLAEVKRDENSAFVHDRWVSLYHHHAENPTREECEAVFNKVLAAHTQPGRHYHNLNHIAESLRRKERFHDAVKDDSTPYHPDAVEWNLFWHDYECQPGLQSNEEQSGRTAEQFARALSLPSFFIEQTYNAIKATRQLNDEEYEYYTGDAFKKAHPDTWFDILLTRDVDYGALAKPWDEFARDTKKLERENVKRLQKHRYEQAHFFETLLGRKNIFFTPSAQDCRVTPGDKHDLTWGTQAKENLQRALETLLS